MNTTFVLSTSHFPKIEDTTQTAKRIGPRNGNKGPKSIVAENNAKLIPENADFQSPIPSPLPPTLLPFLFSHAVYP